MVKRWKPLALGVLTFAAAVSFKNDFLFFLFGFEVMLYLAAFFQVHWLARRVRMEIQLPQNMVFRGRPFQIQAALSNSAVLPVPQLLARVAVRAYPEQEELLMKGKLMLDGSEQGRLCFAMDSSHCGCLEIRADQLVVTDLLGLFQRRCRVERQERFFLFVLPECLKDPVELPDVQGGVLSEDGDNEQRGNTAVDVSEIRAYQPGDELRLVHWKLSARLQKLMVRELSDPVRHMTWLFLNLQETPGKAAVRNDPDAWDHFVEAVAMASSTLLQMEKPHLAIWIDAAANAPVRFDVTDTKSLEQMICALLRANTYQPRDYSRLLKEIYADETQGTCIEIDLQGNFIRSEEPG